MKGDVSGIAQPGEKGGPAEKRAAELGQDWEPTGFPTVLLDRRHRPRGSRPGHGLRLRSAPPRQGPRGERDAGAEPVARVPYADERGLPIVDLADLRALLAFFDSEEGKAELKTIGGVSSATIGVLLRSLAQLEDGGGNEFFGEPQLEIADLLRASPDGRGIISCLELPAVQDKPRLFSTVLVWLLAELFEQLPEVGDIPKPKLVFFFDEAHLLFDEATEAFLDSVVQTVRLIRSKVSASSSSRRRPRTSPATFSRSSGTGFSTPCAPSRRRTRRP